jgi:hypothetical protein
MFESWQGVLDTTWCDKGCQWLTTGFSTDRLYLYHLFIHCGTSWYPYKLNSVWYILPLCLLFMPVLLDFGLTTKAYSAFPLIATEYLCHKKPCIVLCKLSYHEFTCSIHGRVYSIQHEVIKVVSDASAVRFRFDNKSIFCVSSVNRIFLHWNKYNYVILFKNYME